MLPAFYTDEGSGLPLLLIHAFPLNATLWQPQRRDLSRLFRVISFTLPGFGRGGDFIPGMSMDDCADMAVALLDELDVDSAVFGGCSMGGYISLAAYRRHSRRIRGLILSNTRAGADTPEAAANRLVQAEAIRNGGLEEFLAGMREKLVGKSTKDTAPMVLKLVDEMMHSASVEGTAGMLEAMGRRADSTPLLEQADIPICIIAGQEDTMIPPAEAERMHASQAAAELHILPGSGHLSCLERPVVFNSVVEKFLESGFSSERA